MDVNKLIKKVFTTTMLAILSLLAFMILALCLLFPSTMMGITYDLGMESTSIHFASRSYKLFHEVDYIARATEISIEEKDNNKIVTYGDQFIQHSDFAKYCALQGETYGQFIYGQISVSKYEKGNKDGAIELAFSSLNGAFPENNAVTAVLLTSMRQGDTESVAAIKEKLNLISGLSEGDTVYFNKTVKAISDWESSR